MKKPLKVNLQLFADDDQNGVVDHSDDVFDSPEFDLSEAKQTPDAKETGDDNADIEGADPLETDADLEVIEPEFQDEQTPEENAIYKKMRLKAEDEVRKKYEKEFAEKNEALESKRLQFEEEQAEKRIINERVNQDKVYDYADEHGVSTEIAEKLLRQDAQALINAEKKKVHEKNNYIKTVKDELRSDKHFTALEKEVDAIIREHPEADYRMVYDMRRGAKARELDSKLETDVERRTVANMHDRARRRNVSGEGNSSDAALESISLDQTSLEMCQAWGNDPKEISKYVKSQSNKSKRRR